MVSTGGGYEVTMRRTVNDELPSKSRLLVGLFVPWLFGTVLGATIGWVTVFWILDSFAALTWGQSDPAHQVALWGGMGFIYGTLVGLAQWLTLQYWLRRASRWILATALGESAYWIFSFTPGANVTSIGRGSLIGGCGGLALGFVQWIFLRRKFRQAAS